MKLRLLEWLRCPACGSTLQVEDSLMEEYEVMGGSLRCEGCPTRYPIQDGVPAFLQPEAPGVDPWVRRTASSYSVLWGASEILSGNGVAPYHFDVMQKRLSLPGPQGVILDAGCGEGIDLLNQATRTGVEVVGVDVSGEGARASFQRSRVLSTAHVIQADVCRLPFDDNQFDFVYSYGVLHHLTSPSDGLKELVRVLRPGRYLAIYLYEDFSARAVGWRWLLATVNLLRRLTARLPRRALYRLCQASSPLVYALCTVPFLIFRRLPGFRSFAANLPYRHATGPFSLVGDLYDRFSAPIERRYSRTGALALFREAGLQHIIIENERGWMVGGVKPPGASGELSSLSRASAASGGRTRC